MDELELEISHADRMAETLRALLKYCEEDRLHIIAVLGTQITIGQIVEGALAVHDARRATVAS